MQTISFSRSQWRCQVYLDSAQIMWTVQRDECCSVDFCRLPEKEYEAGQFTCSKLIHL